MDEKRSEIGNSNLDVNLVLVKRVRAKKLHFIYEDILNVLSEVS